MGLLIKDKNRDRENYSIIRNSNNHDVIKDNHNNHDFKDNDFFFNSFGSKSLNFSQSKRRNDSFENDFLNMNPFRSKRTDDERNERNERITSSESFVFVYGFIGFIIMIFIFKDGILFLLKALICLFVLIVVISIFSDW